MNRNRTRKHGGNRKNRSNRRNKSHGGNRKNKTRRGGRRRGTRIGRHGSINLYQNKFGLKGFKKPIITW
jgi:hypothetical protein